MLRTIFIVIFVLFIHCKGKYVSESINDTDAEWLFVTRFCFLSSEGEITYEITYPESYGPYKLLLYYDAPNQWEAVYNNDDKNCTEKLQYPHISEAGGQIIFLDTTATKNNGNCSMRETGITGQQEVYCTLSRQFSSSRQRWWYVALSRCKDAVVTSQGQKEGIVFNYNILMTNGESFFFKHFSADEFYILQVDIAFLVALTLLLVMSIICAVYLYKDNFYHATYKLYLASLSLQIISLVFFVMHYGYYANDGNERGASKMMGRFMEIAAYITYIILIFLLAKGYNITRGTLRKSSIIKIVVFFTFYTIVFLVLYLFETRLQDPGLVLYVYESPPGYVLILLRVLAWIWFSYALFVTLKHYPEKKKFYIPFYLCFTVWFWAGPIVILCANFAIAEWTRATVVNGVEQFITFVGYCFFLFLTLPCCVNKVFPYHIKTTQIGVLPPEKYPHQEDADGSMQLTAQKPVVSGHGIGGAYSNPDLAESANQPAAYTIPNGAPNFAAMFLTSKTHSNGDGAESSRTFGVSPTYQPVIDEKPPGNPFLDGRDPFASNGTASNNRMRLPPISRDPVAID